MATREQMKERTEYVVDVLKDANGELVSGDDLLGSLQIEKKTFYAFMARLKKSYPQICHKRSTVNDKGGYYWAHETIEEAPVEVKEEEPEMHKTEEIRDRYGDNRNDEGYFDPTAFEALRSTGSLGTPVEPGEIWNTKISAGGVQPVIVLVKFNSSVTCVPMYTNSGTLYDAERVQCKSITHNGKMVMVNVVKICTKPFKWFEEKVGTLSDENLKRVKGYIGKYLEMDGIGVQIVEKEKVVVKEVKVDTPVKTVTSGHTQKEVDKMIEQAVIAERAAIYKDVAEKLLRRG